LYCYTEWGGIPGTAPAERTHLPIVPPEASERYRRRSKLAEFADSVRYNVEWFKGLFRPPPRMTARQVVEFYQQLGFLEFDSAENVLAQYQEQWGRPFDPRHSYNDEMLLGLDKARVAEGDPEADVAPGNIVYCETLAEWSAVSSDVFAPHHIEEHWQSDEGPITVSFFLGDERFAIDPFWCDDWLDLTILIPLNQLIAASGKQFVCASDVNHAIVFACDAGTRAKLQEVRQFQFAL
jgi:hypothetical protein